MATRSNKAILRRIQERLTLLGKSPRGASLEAGLGPDAIRDLERRPDIIPRIDTIEALAPVLRLSPAVLAFGQGVRPRKGRLPTLHVMGEVAAGLWLDVDGVADQRAFEPVPVPQDPRYTADAQYGLIVRGTSINRIALDGDVLQCVDVGISGLNPESGDLVIVERRRAQAGQKEVTAKRWYLRGKTVELAPDSDDARWSKPLVLDPQKAPDDEEIAVIAIVVGIYRPLKRR